jgi:hypothetical protein
MDNIENVIQIDNTSDLIDSREVISRILHLECNVIAEIPLSEEETAELYNLKVLTEQCEQYCEDWEFGVTLVRDSYFENYARDMAEDIHGDALRDSSWPFCHIDWEEAANQLKIDYTLVFYAGVDYWVR